MCSHAASGRSPQHHVVGWWRSSLLNALPSRHESAICGNRRCAHARKTRVDLAISCFACAFSGIPFGSWRSFQRLVITGRAWPIGRGGLRKPSTSPIRSYATARSAAANRLADSRPGCRDTVGACDQSSRACVDPGRYDRRRAFEEHRIGQPAHFLEALRRRAAARGSPRAGAGSGRPAHQGNRTQHHTGGAGGWLSRCGSGSYPARRTFTYRCRLLANCSTP